MALLNCTRYPRLTCTSPLSSVQGTRKVTMRSGSTSRSMIFARSNSGCALYTSSMEESTSRTACKYSFSPGCFSSKERSISSVFMVKVVCMVSAGASLPGGCNVTKKARKSVRPPPLKDCKSFLAETHCVFASDRLRLGSASRKSAAFTDCVALALHYLWIRQAAARHRNPQKRGFCKCVALALHYLCTRQGRNGNDFSIKTTFSGCICQTYTQERRES